MPRAPVESSADSRVECAAQSAAPVEPSADSLAVGSSLTACAAPAVRVASWAGSATCHPRRSSPRRTPLLVARRTSLATRRGAGAWHLRPQQQRIARTAGNLRNVAQRGDFGTRATHRSDRFDAAVRPSRPKRQPCHESRSAVAVSLHDGCRSAAPHANVQGSSASLAHKSQPSMACESAADPEHKSKDSSATMVPP